MKREKERNSDKSTTCVSLLQVRARISVQQKRHSVHSRFGRDRAGSHDGKFQMFNKRSTEVSPLVQSGSRSPISESETQVNSEKSSRATSTSALLPVDENYQDRSESGSTTSIQEDVNDGEDRQPVAILSQSPKLARKGLGQKGLDMIEEGEEPTLTVPTMGRPRSLTDPGEWKGR